MSKPKLPLPETPTEEQTAAADTEAGLATLVRKQKDDFDRALKEIRDAFTFHVSELARLKDRYDELTQKYSALLEERQQMRHAWDNHHRESSDGLLKFGAEVRKLTQRIEQLEQLRAVQTDPHAVVKPLKLQIGALRDDFNLLVSKVDRALERVSAGQRTARRDPAEPA